MSYILEALKKSQRDRELGQVPDLTAEPYMDSSAPRSGMAPWIIGSVLIALIALLIALYAVFGRQPGEPDAPRAQIRDQPLQQQQRSAAPAPKAVEQAPAQPPQPVPTAKVEPEPAPQTAGTAPKPAVPAEKKVSVRTARETAATASSAQKPPSKQTKEPAATVSSAQQPPSKQTEVERIRQEYAQMKAREKQQEQQQERKAQAGGSKPPGRTAEPVKQAHPAAHDLPPEVQSRLPPRNIMLQSYSENPADRFVILNSVKLYQGQSTADGLKVVEIRADGLLLEFETYEFFQPR